MKKKTQDNSTAPEPSPRKARVAMQNLAGLQALVDAPMGTRFEIDGQQVEVSVRRLKPEEEDMILAIEREAIPPRKQGPQGEYYDHNDRGYQATQEQLAKEARAMTLYLACPTIQQGQPGLKSRAEITAYVKGILTNNILDLIYLTIRVGGIKVAEGQMAERVGFTTTPGSAQS